MKVLSIDNNNSTVVVDVKVNVKGCYYPKGFVIQFNNGDNLIDFILQLPDDV